MYITNILQYLEMTVAKCPYKLSFSDGESGLSFAQLYNKARAVGSFLSARGYYGEPIVVICEKKPDTIAAFMGIIYSGCFYVCLDTQMPVSRMELIFESLKPRAVIYDKDNEKIAKELEGSLEMYRLDDIFDTEIDEDRLCSVRQKQIDTDPIYIVFTSGSTGSPKGVLACHRSVIDYTETLCEALGFCEQTVFANQAPLYFDAPLKEIMPTIKLGATTYLVPPSLFMFPIKLCEYLSEHKVNTICWVVSALVLISSLGALNKNKPRYLTKICFGSEVFPIKEYQKWREAYPRAKFINLYGPTEATGMSCYWIAERELEAGELIPVGKPFRNTAIMLIGDDGARSEIEGEIYIRGTCVTLGYFNDKEKTGERFVQSPSNSSYSETVYRTGDIGKYNKYGELVFLTRKDFQIKHMGHRIELMEIEAVAERNDNVTRACALYNNDSKKIVLYFTGEIDERGIVEYLRSLLPRYMLPSVCRRLDSMPLTQNGKLDRSLLSRRAFLNEEN